MSSPSSSRPFQRRALGLDVIFLLLQLFAEPPVAEQHAVAEDRPGPSRVDYVAVDMVVGLGYTSQIEPAGTHARFQQQTRQKHRSQLARGQPLSRELSKDETDHRKATSH